MKVERDGDSMRLILDLREVTLLRHALERASFIDTPVSEQAAIAAFCARVLESLPSPRP